jgi:hypothetical protein
MVTIIGYKTRTKGNGESFNCLILQGGAEVHTSTTTGKHILNSRRASIVSSLDEEACKDLIGTKIPGTIEKVAVNEYPYQLPGTNEVVILKHTYEYSPQNEINFEIGKN